MAYQKTIWTNNLTQLNADNMNKIENGIYSSVPIGSVMEFAGTTAPDGWLICDGSAISRETYSALFNVIGVYWGEGDGSTTFNLPPYQGKVGVGLDPNDTDFDTIGKTYGTKTVTLNINQIPPHKFDIVTAQTGGGDAPAGYNYSQNGGVYNSNFVRQLGGGQPHNNVQPSLAINKIIKY